MKLERLSYQFEARRFRSRRSLAYVKPGDLDAFFTSPDKLLSGKMNSSASGKELFPHSKSLEPKRLSMTPTFVPENVERRPGVSRSSGGVMAALSSSQQSNQVYEQSM